MLEHERKCFEHKIRDYGEFQLATYCLLGEPAPLNLNDYDAFMVGGSGDYGCVNNTTPWFARAKVLLKRVVDEDRPMFCSCFGHQALAAAMGGEVITDRDRSELGTFPISLTEEGKKDPLFGSLPPQFNAQLGHNDHVTVMPRGAVQLASSARCHIQAYRLPGKPVYATQFHPELNQQDNIHRASGYMHVYDVEQKCPDRLKGAFLPSPEASTLLPRFLALLKEGRL